MKLLNLWLIGPVFLLLTACNHHKDIRESACASLEQAIALERAGVDTTDLSILQPALDFFPKEGDGRQRLLLWYHLGRIRFNRGEYGEASVCFRKAAAEACAAGDPLYEGKSYRALADVYNRTWNVREDSLCLLRAFDAFERAGDTLSVMETRIRLAGAYYNDKQWDKASQQYRQALETTHPVLRARCLAHYGSFLLDAPDGSPARALACLQEAAAAGEPFTPRRLSDYGFALYIGGAKDDAGRLWAELDRRFPSGFPQLDYRRYCLFRQEGRLDRALSYLERCSHAQDSLWRNQTSEAVSEVQREYIEAVAEQERLKAEREKFRRRSAVAGGLLLTLLLAMAAAVLIRRERARRVTVQQALTDSQRLVGRLQEAERTHLNKIHNLNRDVRVARSSLEEVRADYLYLFRSGYKRLGELFEVRSTTGSDKAVCQRVSEILKEIDGDRKGLRKLRKFIDEKLDKPVSGLQADIPDLKEEDIRLFCYLVIGYEPSLISLLMGIDNLNTVYSRKYRLSDRIKKLSPAKAKRYLDLMN